MQTRNWYWFDAAVVAAQALYGLPAWPLLRCSQTRVVKALPYWAFIAAIGVWDVMLVIGGIILFEYAPDSASIRYVL